MVRLIIVLFTVTSIGIGCGGIHYEYEMCKDYSDREISNIQCDYRNNQSRGL